MLFRDILLHYVDVAAQRNTIKNTTVEKRDTENNISSFFNYILISFVLLLTLSLIFLFLSSYLQYPWIQCRHFEISSSSIVKIDEFVWQFSSIYT